MTAPREKYGEEFIFDKIPTMSPAGQRIFVHQACVCIAPVGDREATLNFAWSVARELAQWLAGTFADAPDDDRFQIIVAWSQNVRRHQGHIFKIWGYKGTIRQIASTESYRDYALATGNPQVPMTRWEKDVFPHQ